MEIHKEKCQGHTKYALNMIQLGKIEKAGYKEQKIEKAGYKERVIEKTGYKEYGR
jgi:hypothetical protein